jgi:hypothetical protein
MITENLPTVYSVKVNGVVVCSNVPSRQLAEAAVMNLPPEQRIIAEIVTMTGDGKVVLFG